MLNFQFVGVLVLNSFHENVPKHSIVIVDFIWKLSLPVVVTKRFLLISIPNSALYERSNEYNYTTIFFFIFIIKVRAVFGILHASSILHTYGEFMTSDCNIMLAFVYSS